MDDVYNKIDDYNPTRNKKILVVFDDTIADIMNNKKCQAIIKELLKKIKYISCIYQTIFLLFQKKLD